MGEESVAVLQKLLSDISKKMEQVLISMAEIKKDQNRFEARLAEQQEEIAAIADWRHACELRDAHSKGRVAAYVGAGGFIVFLADRLRLWDALAAMFR